MLLLWLLRDHSSWLLLPSCRMQLSLSMGLAIFRNAANMSGGKYQLDILVDFLGIQMSLILFVCCLFLCYIIVVINFLENRT